MKKTSKNKLFLCALLVIVLLALAAVACVDSGGGVSSKGGSLNSVGNNTENGPNATATYGAEQFHLQLTAVAQPESTRESSNSP
ncbi:MAG: hypothetical protein B6D39_11295 [Anaerolineae bacterium UTCFX2]|jgi:ABC-type oligopeptide transport system substrate-binding subunit|nr:MAG: hypothetical protein B6D39_11295 [Anaerolineae bacterium UTCFX2]